MQPPKINVTIPLYNRPHLIERAVTDALRLDYPNKTVTVVDDGSTRSSDDVMHRFRGEPGLTYLKLNRNVGADTAKNVGLLVSQYDYITFHDSDDIYDARKLQLQLDQMLTKQAEVIYGKFIHVDEQGQIHLRGDRLTLVRDLYPNIVRERFDTYILFNPGLYSREVFKRIGGYCPGRFGGDDDLQYRVVLSGTIVNFIDQPLIIKLDQPDSITLDPETGFRSRLAKNFYAKLHADIERYRTQPDSLRLPVDLPVDLRVETVFAGSGNEPALAGDIPAARDYRTLLS